MLLASSPAEAFEAIERHDGRIHLLLTDVLLPSMSGGEIAARLTSSHPATKVLYMTGHTDDAVVRQGILGDKAAFLQRPFSVAKLTGKVREVLDEARPDRVASVRQERKPSPDSGKLPGDSFRRDVVNS